MTILYDCLLNIGFYSYRISSDMRSIAINFIKLFLQKKIIKLYVSNLNCKIKYKFQKEKKNWLDRNLNNLLSQNIWASLKLRVHDLKKKKNFFSRTKNVKH